MRLFMALAALLLSVAGARAEPELFDYETKQFGWWTVVCATQVSGSKDCSAVQRLIVHGKEGVWAAAQVRFIAGEPKLFFMVPPEAKAGKNISIRYGRESGIVNLSCKERECQTEWGLGKKQVDRFLHLDTVLIGFAMSRYWGEELRVPMAGLKEALADIVAKSKKSASR